MAETLNDKEMIEVSSTINEWLELLKRPKRKGDYFCSAYAEDGELKYVLDHDIIENVSYVANSKEVDFSTDGIYEEFGSGVQKLRNLGILTVGVQQSTFSYEEDSERHINQDGTAQVTLKTISFPLSYRRIFTLIDSVSSGREL